MKNISFPNKLEILIFLGEMLVLSRKKDQKLLIGENVTITVLEIKGSQVRLGITAPNQVPVHREEIVSLEKTT